MERSGSTDAVLPELAALRGVEQSHYHHLDVYEHTLAVLGETIALEHGAGAAVRRSGGGDPGAAGRAAGQ